MTVDLRTEPAWDPAILLRPDLSTFWPYQAALQALDELTEMFMPRSTSLESEPVVRPNCVDTRTGSITTTRSSTSGRLVLRYGSGPGRLRPGDVLLPLSGVAPCVLISDEHRGMSFTGFLALRPRDPVPGEWLWAVLSSGRGIAYRRALSAGSTGGLRLSQLHDAVVPSPLPLADGVLGELRRLLDAAVVRPSAGGSWWRVARLPRTGDWRWTLASPTPEKLTQGIRLGEIAEVLAGRAPRITFDNPRPGTMPVYIGPNVGGRAFDRWADPGTLPQVGTGDVLVVEVGTKGRAAVPRQEGLAGKGVLVVRPRRPGLATGLAAYLDGESAQEIRSMLVTGATIPRLTVAALAEFPVPELVTKDDATPASDDLLLADALDRALWS